jgi:predicted AAA+ superfamily ATPase
MVRQLPPWYENLGKHQVKAPKIYLRDSGLLRALLSLPDFHILHGYPRVGASWEGFAIEQALEVLRRLTKRYRQKFVDKVIKSLTCDFFTFYEKIFLSRKHECWKTRKFS